MSGIPGAGGDAALRRLHERFSVVMIATGPGFTQPTELLAVRSNAASDDFQGAGRSARRTTLEFLMSDFAEAPDKAEHRFTDDRGRVWVPVDIVRRDDVDRWSIDVALSV